MFILSSISSSLEFWSVSHILIYENSKSKVCWIMLTIDADYNYDCNIYDGLMLLY